AGDRGAGGRHHGHHPARRGCPRCRTG
ncbi:MAG: hypothetical protein AVDCRST_MAG89-1321, partial [uncultured Gemmatimonadetes bacterium]